MSLVSQHRGPERSLHETAKAKFGLCWRNQYIGDDRVMGYQLKKAAKQEQKQPKRKKCVSVNKEEKHWGAEECFDITHGDEVFGVCPASFQSYFGPVFHYFLYAPFRMVRYILCHFMLEVCIYDLLFYFDLNGDYS